MGSDLCECGARLTPGALACSLCHAAVPAAPVTVPDEAPLGPNGFLPAPPRPALRLDERKFSRVQQGPLSFGPLGRVVISAAMIVPVWFMWYLSGGGWLSLVGILPAALLPAWYLRETWRRHRVR
jgi:hypothetical protein